MNSTPQLFGERAGAIIFSLHHVFVGFPCLLEHLLILRLVSPVLQEMAKCPTSFEPVSVEAEHTMFIMYTSGTTAAAKPTGIKHCTAGYLLYVALTHQVLLTNEAACPHMQ